MCRSIAAIVPRMRGSDVDKGVRSAVETLLADVAVDRLAQRSPLLERRLEAEGFRALDAAVERDPGHHLGKHIVPAVAAPLPDPVIRLVPDLGKVLEHHAFEVPTFLAKL